ncbi:MAG: hypothetical protein KKF20_07920, partial [Bacteroidetes bacterium]|nr:hypothetical protein [Bacteroidota bacterium]
LQFQKDDEEVERDVQIFFAIFLLRLKSVFCTTKVLSSVKNDFLRDNYLLSMKSVLMHGKQK